MRGRGAYHDCMRLYVALTFLEEDEWRVGTGYTRCMGAAELCLRRCLRKEVVFNGMFGGHVSLYFESANDRMIQANAQYATQEAIGASNFSVDVLENDPHAVNLIRGCQGWYAKWQHAVVQLYRVEATDAEIERAHDESLRHLRDDTAYSCAVNVNALVPCCCCPCFYLWPANWFRSRGVNCVSHVLTALRVGLGKELVKRRVLPGARLPSELVDQLLRNGEVTFERDVVLNNRETGCEEVLPLIALR